MPKYTSDYPAVHSARKASLASDLAILAVFPDPNACDAGANNDGQLAFFGIARYIQLFNAGCA